MNAKRNLIVSGALFTVVLAAWPVMVIIAKAPGGVLTIAWGLQGDHAKVPAA